MEGFEGCCLGGVEEETGGESDIILLQLNIYFKKFKRKEEVLFYGWMKK